jgi:hypothetical protein
MRQALTQLQSIQGESIQDLQTQLDEANDILVQLESKPQLQLLQVLLQVILFSVDADHESILLSDEQIDEMIGSMQDVPGVTVDENQLRQLIVDHGRSIRALLEVARHALTAEVPVDYNVFTFK